MKKFTLLLLLIPAFAIAQQQVQRPKLVVGIVVDQMRWDYLYRYYNRYSDGGFRRLLNDGYSCENTLINYLPSYTAVGHTCIFTGSVPSITGIAGNDWMEQLTGEKVYCTDDSTVQSVGSQSDAGKMSPRNLLVSTVTDELRIATNYKSKVVGVSLKDRASILPAGHTANAAFWLDDSNGHFITSTYYMQQLPDWAKQFNSHDMIKHFVAEGWKTLYPINTYQQSDSDDEAYEGKLNGEQKPVFPHQLMEAYQKDPSTLRYTPYGNTLTLKFAEAAIDGYQLGKGTATDFLTINCASTDYVGHKFGPNSIEVEDTYLRLDKDLADLFNKLDKELGKNNYLVFLSADHGAAHNIGYMKKHELPADNWNDRALTEKLNTALSQQFGADHLVRYIMNYQVDYDMKTIVQHNLDFDKVKKATTDFLKDQPGISYAVDMEHIGEAPVPQLIKSMMINGYNYKRSGPVQIILNAGWFEGTGKTGTTHGTWYPYDTHIPLVFMGWHIKHGATNQTINMTDIAPTVAALLHIQMPNGCIGTPITAITGEAE